MVAGATIPAIAVTVEDAAGVKIPSSSADVEIGLPGGSIGLLFGGYDAKAVTGVATFSGLSLPKAGTYTFIATSPGLASATSGSIVVQAGPAYRVAFAPQPTGGAAGAAFTVVVLIRDLYSNNTTASGSVSLDFDFNQTSGTLSGTTTVSAVNGVATFTNVRIDKPGIYRLNATSAGLAIGQRNGFTISP